MTLAWLMQAVPATAATFHLSFVETSVRAVVSTAVATDGDTANLFAPTGSIRAEAIATATSPRFGSATAVHTVSAEFFSSQAGRVQTLWGWDNDILRQPTSTVWEAETNLAPLSWAYTFTTTGSGRLRATYAQQEFNRVFSLLFPAGAGLLLDQHPFDFVLPGSYDIPLAANTTYTVGIRNVSGDTNTVQGAFSTRALGTLDWAIEYDPPVVIPLPGGAAPMLVSLLWLARRRRTGVGLEK